MIEVEIAYTEDKPIDERIEHLFGYALVEKCTLSDARTALSYSITTLGEAVKYRLGVSINPPIYIDNYQDSIKECVSKLMRSN